MTGGNVCQEATLLPALDDVVGAASQDVSAVFADTPQWFSVEMKDSPENKKNSYHVRIELEDPSDQLRLVVIRGGCEEKDATPEVKGYDWCVAFSGDGAGHAICDEKKAGVSECADFTSPYRVGVLRGKPGSACLPFSLKMTARAGDCAGLTSVCGTCKEGEGRCLLGEPFLCEGGQLKKSTPCKPKVCHQTVCVGNGVCEQIPLPEGAPCEGGVCSAKATCGCAPGTTSCVPGSPAKFQTCTDEGVYTEVVCPKGCNNNVCATM